MTCTHSIIATIAALAFGHASAQLGNAPPSALSAPGSSFGHQVQSAPAANAAGTAQSPPADAVKPNPAVAPKSAVMTPAQMTQQKASSSAANQGVAADKRAASPAATRLTDERLSITSPRRALLIRQEEALRVQQDPAVQPVQRNPGTGIAPGALASTAGVRNYAASYTPQTAAGVTVHKLTEPGIVLVNGKQSAIHVTPGRKLVISGYGFGDARGNAYLVGGGLEKQPLLLSIGKWRNDEIEAYIPGGTRGVADEPGGGLKVVTAAGAAYRMEGINFRAAREETTLTGDPVRAFFIVEPGATWSFQVYIGGAVKREESSMGAFDCKRPGTDVLRFRTLNGFDVIGATLGHGRTDSGDGDGDGQPGGRVFFPGYGFGAWTDERVTRPLGGGTEDFVSALPVNWGVYRAHRSPNVAAGVSFAGPYVNSTSESNSCSSYYEITSLRLYGPAGVAPF